MIERVAAAVAEGIGGEWFVDAKALAKYEANENLRRQRNLVRWLNWLEKREQFLVSDLAEVQAQRVKAAALLSAASQRRVQ